MPARANASLAGIFIVISSLLAGCAAPLPPADTGPQARFTADQAECRRAAQQIDVVAQALDGMAQGALVLAAIAWGGGGNKATVGDWAALGGVVGGVGQGGEALQRRLQAEQRCMAARGYAPGGPLLARPTEPGWKTPTPPAPPIGQDAFSAQRLARSQSCSAQPVAALAAKGPGFELYSVPCDSGDALAIRCEFGNCRVLR
ncbi:MAG TPA: glycine zipper family protein [Burkholderiaceae bacterium]